VQARNIGYRRCAPPGSKRSGESINLLLPDAVRPGSWTSFSNAIVARDFDRQEHGTRPTVRTSRPPLKREMHVKARVVVVAAGCPLKARGLLMNSGIANSSGVLGHYLHDQIYAYRLVGSVPEAPDEKPGPGRWAAAAFIPRFRNLSKSDRRNFIKGYCMIIGSAAGRTEFLRGVW